MHPLLSAIFDSVRASIRSLSMFRAPKSLTRIPKRSPEGLLIRRLISVVLPAPRKPQMSDVGRLTGTFSSRNFLFV